MCGIAGAFNREEAFKLYQANLTRGRYSAGLLVHYLNDVPIKPTVIKTPTPFKLEEVPIGGALYLFHSRAPTSRTTEYDPIDTHPFNVDNVWVAHNGILSNATELAEKYEINYSLPEVSMVDSYVIAHMINAEHQQGELWLETIKRCVEQFKGTFGLWIYIYENNRPRLFICRSGSTLYGNLTTGAFSSSPQKEFKLLEEGQIYTASSFNGLTPSLPFKTKPIYFIA